MPPRTYDDIAAFRVEGISHIDFDANCWESIRSGLRVPPDILGIESPEPVEPFDVPDDHFKFRED